MVTDEIAVMDCSRAWIGVRRFDDDFGEIWPDFGAGSPSLSNQRPARDMMKP